MTGFEPLTDFENDYEVEVDEPHRIRRIGSDRFVSTYVDRLTGYVRLNLNRRNYYIHRILARHFIPNPNNLPQVDHIDRDPLNNSIENLRWVSASDNNRNRVINRARFEYLNMAPNDIIEITRFDDVEYAPNKYFFCCENDQVVQRYNDHRWRFLSLDITNGYAKINMTDINGRRHHVYLHKLIHHFRYEQTDEEYEEEEDIEE